MELCDDLLFLEYQKPITDYFKVILFSSDIAASAFGRDFLITNQNGRQVIDTYIKVLSEAPQGKSARMKKWVNFDLEEQIRCLFADNLIIRPTFY